MRKKNDFSNGDQLNFWRHTTERWHGIYSTLALVYVIQMLNKQTIHGDVKLFAHQTNFQMENALRLQFRYFDEREWARTSEMEWNVEQECCGSQASNNIKCSIGSREKNTVPST